jgi:ribosomal protein L37AE/L43A
MVYEKLTSEYSVQLGYSFNLRLGKNLELWRNAVINQDIDCAGVIDGKEGGGKSVLAQQVACFLDVDRRIDCHQQIFYTAEDVEKAIKKLPRNKAIIFDEAGEGMDRRESTKDMNVKFNKVLKRCRQYNQFLIFVMPSFYDMDMVGAVWRTRFLLHVSYRWDLRNRESPLKRGYFRFYSEQGKKALYTDKWKRNNYLYPYIEGQSFDATFPHHHVVPKEEYVAWKRENDEKLDSKGKYRMECPQCSGHKVRYQRTKGVWQCGYCDWEGPPPYAPTTQVQTEGMKK